MRERLTVLVLAAAALGLFYVLFFPKPQQELDTGRPLSTESRPEGYQAAWRWLAEQHIPVASLRYRYDRLPGLLPSPTGNLLLMTLPQRVPARAAELATLEEWVKSGNTLLILAAIHETPPLWAFVEDYTLFRDRVGKLTGLHFEERSGSTDVRSLLSDQKLDIKPRGEHALLAGVRHVTAVSTLPFGHVRLRSKDDAMPLELAARSDNGDSTLWLLRRGAGQIILSSVVSPFSNGAVALDDNARLLANIIAWCCSSGTVVFDDAHQGAAAYYDGKAFFADPRLHRTLEWIVLLWLCFVLGALPLRAVQRTWQPLDETTYVEASARYLAAVVTPADAAQRLIERFLRRFRGRSDTDRGALWESIDAHARVASLQRRTLHGLYEQACAAKRVDLTRLQNLLVKLRGILE
jgi:hypothetical protein